MEPTLLISDGDAESCDRYRRFFAEHGYIVEFASHGLDCLEKLYEMRPALLVLDLELRWGGSDNVLSVLRATDGRRQVPVILTAPAHCPNDMSDFLRPPVVRLLRKPFTPMALLESVQAALAAKDGSEPFGFHWPSPMVQTIGLKGNSHDGERDHGQARRPAGSAHARTGSRRFRSRPTHRGEP